MADLEIPERLRNAAVVPKALAGHVPELPPSSALAMLPSLGLDPDRHLGILREALADRKLPPQVRALAVLSLTQLGAETAVAEARRVLQQPQLEEMIAARAVTLLGRLGGSEQLGLVTEIQQAAPDGVLRVRAAFARTLIVHRFRLQGVDLGPPPVERRPLHDAAGALEFKSRLLGFPVRERVLLSVREVFPSVLPHEYAVHEIECGRGLMEVAVPVALTGPGQLGLLAAQPFLAAFLLSEGHEPGTFVPHYVALTRPGPAGEVLLHVATLTGEVVFVGDGRASAAEAVIKLDSAASPGMPLLSAVVQIDRDGLRISGLVGRQIQPPLPTEPAEPPG
ncbi:HEAT repeat domain-containing protein [Nonomuraea zeae]|uniref:HEAT repeat domain-containing protein n=1 Tax=Nonomuraea zeae TaxID=1642303 RepID=A0A5S4G898_9ACTN|nr:HEAT repeat domain-containing protein [Nonomuraea zeae]TMR29069.1 HEAT repeat domain-containing protein [Nonomuraea zeae]